MIRLIASDLDRTLLNARSEPSPRTLAAIRAFAGRGGVFAPVTGRAYQDIPRWIREMPEIARVLYANGARCIENATGETVRFAGMKPETADAVWAAIEPYPCRWLLFASRQAFCEDHTAPRAASELRAKIFEPGLEIEKIDLYFTDLRARTDAWAAIQQIPGVKISAAYDCNIEVNGPEGDKGSGLANLARELDVAKDEIMAFGDGLNDVSLLSAAGFPVAVANAVPALREIARFVTLSHDQDGVAVAIERFAL